MDPEQGTAIKNPDESDDGVNNLCFSIDIHIH